MDLRFQLYSGSSIHRSQLSSASVFPGEGQGLPTTEITSSSSQQWDAATDIIIVIAANQQYQESEDRHHYHQRGKHAVPCSICRSLILRYIAALVELRSNHLLLLVTCYKSQSIAKAKPLPRPPQHAQLSPALHSLRCELCVMSCVLFGICCKLCVVCCELCVICCDLCVICCLCEMCVILYF